MQTLPTATITAGQSVTISAGARGTCGAVAIFNESNSLLRVAWGGSAQWLPAWVGDVFYMNQDPGFTGSFTIQANTISTALAAPSSVVAMHVFAPGERVPGTFPVPLVRQANLGNGTLPVTNAPAVINDGNPPGTTVVEATPSTQLSSCLKLLNDGTSLIAIENDGALLDALTITPGTGTTLASGSLGDAANPGNWRLHGTADVASSVWAGDVTGGTLPSGVDLTSITSDGGKITSDGNGNLTVNGALNGTTGTTLPTIRNGAASSVPIFTGTSTPTGSIPVGAIWVEA